MKLMTLKQYMNMSKPALIRKITKTLKVMPKVKLARLCYNITKSKLPRLKIQRPKFKQKYEIMRSDPLYRSGMSITEIKKLGLARKAGKYMTSGRTRKTKRKFSRKQLAAQRLFAKRARAGTLKRRRR